MRRKLQYHVGPLLAGGPSSGWEEFYTPTGFMPTSLSGCKTPPTNSRSCRSGPFLASDVTTAALCKSEARP
jgi:hypothetical protein